jgi:hypothetical protein
MQPVHKRRVERKAGRVHGWVTTFGGISFEQTRNFLNGDYRSAGIPCAFCFNRLLRQLQSWKAHSPDDAALVLSTSTGDRCIQVRLVDPEDGMSEWTYSLLRKIPREERKKYGSTV